MSDSYHMFQYYHDLVIDFIWNLIMTQGDMIVCQGVYHEIRKWYFFSNPACSQIMDTERLWFTELDLKQPGTFPSALNPLFCGF